MPLRLEHSLNCIMWSCVLWFRNLLMGGGRKRACLGSCRNLFTLEIKKREKERKNVGTVVLFICFRF